MGRSGLLPSDFDDVAFFVYRFSFGIGFAGLKLNRLVSNGTDREPHLGREAHSLYVGTIPLIVRRCRYASAQMDFGQFGTEHTPPLVLGFRGLLHIPPPCPVPGVGSLCNLMIHNVA